MILVAAMTAFTEVASGQMVMPQAARPERPYRGLFASGPTDTGQSLTATATLGGGYDDNILFEAGQIGGGGGGSNPLVAKSGGLASADGTIRYSLSTARFNLGSSFGSMYRYFPGTQDPSVSAHSANAGASLKIGRRSTLLAAQTVQYQPFIFMSIFNSFNSPTLAPFDAPELGQLGQLDSLLIDQATSRNSYLSYASSVSFQNNFTPRLSFATGYGFANSNTAYVGGKYTSHSGNAGVHYSLTRDLGLRAGYLYQESRFPASDERAQVHTADVGVDYRKALSFSRRTTLAFATGTSAVTYGGSRTFQVTGYARLNHEIGRTWTASGGYSRSVQFVDLALAPVLYDGIEASVGGLINRRVELQSGLWASIGNIGIRRVSALNDYDTFLAGTSVSIALNTYAKVTANYGFYHYRFDELTFLPIGVPRKVDRQSARVLLSLWAPLMQRGRR